MSDVLTLTAPRTDVPVRRTAPSLPALVGLEMRKSLSTRSGKALAVAGMLMAPLATAAIGAASTERLPVADGPLGIMGLLTAYLLISLGVLSTAGEWSHRTVQTTFLLVPHRGRVLAAKVAAVAQLGAAVAAVSTALTAGALAVVESGMSWDGAVRAMGAAVVGGAAFAVIGAGVGAALANTPAALTGLYLLLLGAMSVLSTFKPDVADRIDPANAVLHFAHGTETTQSVVNLAGWLAVTTVAGWTLTHRRAVQ
ncbi:UNVERIFIED_ORG: hypothetical protein E4P37_17935 [Bacillus sp. AZ43]